MKQSDLSLPLYFIIWRRYNFLWNTIYLTLVLQPVTEIDLLLLHRAPLRLPWWGFKPEHEMVKFLWLPRCLSFSLLLQRSAHFAKVSPGRRSMWEGRSGGLLSNCFFSKAFLLSMEHNKFPHKRSQSRFISAFIPFVCFFKKTDIITGREHRENKQNLNNILLWNILVTAESICATVF